MESNKISRLFYTIGTQVVYALLIPVFYTAFIFIYHPFHLEDYFGMGRNIYPFNLTMTACIILLTLLLTRTLFYYVTRKVSFYPGWYFFWCACEIIVCIHFVSLYTWLMFIGVQTYFEVLGKTTFYLTFILALPYVLIGLSVRSHHRHHEQDEKESIIRFHDESGKEKLILPISDLLYIKASENYIEINYISSGRVKTLMLRNTMKSIEGLGISDRVIRCHRSFYVNAMRVKVLRKDEEGIIYAELDSPELKKVPVTKRYYEALSQML